MSEKLKNLRRNKSGEIVYGYLTEEQRNDIEIMAEIIRQEEERIHTRNIDEIIEISGTDVKRNTELNARLTKLLEKEIEILRDNEFEYGIRFQPIVNRLIQRHEDIMKELKQWVD